MALTRIPGGLRWPRPLTTRAGFNDVILIDATAERFGAVGHVYIPGGGTKSIRKVHFVTGTCAINAASELILALQNVNAAAGDPAQPDGTDDETVTILGSAISSGAWITTGNLSADRSVTDGDALGLEIRYSTFTAADAARIQCYDWQLFGTGSAHWPSANLFATTWQQSGEVPNVLFEFSDGTFGCFYGAWPAVSSSTVSFNSGSAADEIGLKFQVAAPCSIRWADAILGPTGATGGDFDLVLYNAAGSSIASRSYDGQWRLLNEARNYYLSLPETDLSAGVDYRLVIKPTGANNVTLGYWTLSAAGHREVWPGGTNACYTARADGGAWTDTTTRIPEIYPGFSRFDDGAGGGGGGSGEPANLSGGIHQ